MRIEALIRSVEDHEFEAKLRRAWEEQMWRVPDLWEDPEAYRATLLLPTVSLLPEASLEALRRLYGGDRFSSLSQDEVLAAVTAQIEGQVTKNRLATMTPLHPADITTMLREMAGSGLLEQALPRRGVYQLPRSVAPSSTYSGPSSSYSDPSSTHFEEPGAQSGDARQIVSTSDDEIWEVLLRIAEPARKKRWVARGTMRSIVISLCSIRGLRLIELAELMDRNPQSLRQQYLIPLIEEGRLRYLYPGEPTHPHQAYLATETAADHEVGARDEV